MFIIFSLNLLLNLCMVLVICGSLITMHMLLFVLAGGIIHIHKYLELNLIQLISCKWCEEIYTIYLQNRKNDEASYEKMLKLRRDLSRAVTILEMIKRREKSKRELLHLTLEIMEKR